MKTSYRSYRWLINTLEDAGEEGCTIPQLRKLYDIYRSDERKARGLSLIQDRELPGPKKLTRTNYYNWRAQVWVQFGLHIDTPVKDNLQVLMNPDELDNDKKLREVIDFLVDEEERNKQKSNKQNPLPTNSMQSKKVQNAGQPTQGQTMGFVTMGNGSNVNYDNLQYGYQEVEEPEMVNTIRFAMTFGEALVIRYGKFRERWERDTRMKQKEKPDRYVLEPQQLKCINDRWYVAGHLYEYGNRDTSRVSIYDVEQIQICEDEDIAAPRYEVVEGFDIYNRLPEDWTEHFDPDKVVSMYLRIRGCLMEKHPFCQAQMKVEFNAMFRLYQVYLKPNKDFFIQYMAYGDEVSVVDMSKKYGQRPTDLTRDQIGYLKALKRNKL